MVGEIRDKETAVLAVQAALTGHLVFSTIHTNTSFGAIPRLVDMGVDPFLIAPTLVAVIGQRLVRKLCNGAGAPFPVTDSLKEFLNREFSDLPEAARAKLPPVKEFYHATPTAECPGWNARQNGCLRDFAYDERTGTDRPQGADRREDIRFGACKRHAYDARRCHHQRV